MERSKEVRRLNKDFERSNEQIREGLVFVREFVEEKSIIEKKT